MAGHNKWSKIKHKKGASDAQKSAVFSKLARAITVEAKKAAGNTDSPGLRLAIDKAKQANMPGDNIDRAIKRAASAEGAAMEEVVYETYGPGGSALIIVGLTDNKNRTGAEIKHLLSKKDMSLAAPGSALWAFTKTDEGYTPQTTVELSDADGEKLRGIVEELEEHDDVQEVFTNAV